MGEKQEKEALSVLSESILSILNNLIEDIIKMQAVNNNVTVLETRFTAFVAQFTDFKDRYEDLLRALKKDIDCSTRLSDCDFKYNLLSVKLKNLEDEIKQKNKEEIKEKKDYYIMYGKGVVITSIILFVITTLLGIILKKFI